MPIARPRSTKSAAGSETENARDPGVNCFSFQPRSPSEFLAEQARKPRIRFEQDQIEESANTDSSFAHQYSILVECLLLGHDAQNFFRQTHLIDR